MDSLWNQFVFPLTINCKNFKYRIIRIDLIATIAKRQISVMHGTYKLECVFSGYLANIDWTQELSSSNLRVCHHPVEIELH